jgi:hypothetical protein
MWFVNTAKEDMQAGKAAGYMAVRSEAMLPEEIAEGAVWVVADGKGGWAGAPRVRAGALPPRLFPAAGSAEEEAVLQRLAAAGSDSGAGGGGAVGAAAAALHRQRLEQLEVGRLAAGSLTALQVVRALVLERLRSVRARFPAASEDELCEALVCYSPESWLYAKGLSADDSEDPVDEQQWDKYQGELHYGSYQAFHGGSAAVLGTEIADGDAMGAIALEVLEQGEASDRYNLWYFLFCAAVEQNNYNEKGELRENASTRKPKVRAGARATADC